MKVILSGHITISEKTLTEEQKQKVLQAKEGFVKVMRIELMDSNGKEYILEGPLRISKSGNLTASFSKRISEFEVVEIPLE